MPTRRVFVAHAVAVVLPVVSAVAGAQPAASFDHSYAAWDALLKTQLEDGMTRFMGDRTRNRFANGKAEISAIFKWFAEDFEKGHKGFHKVHDVVTRYAEQLAETPAEREKLRSPVVTISYLEYDWTLNAQGR